MEPTSRRIFFVAVNTGYARHGLPDHRFVDFYTRRASAELYCAIIGNIVIPGGVGSNAGTPVLDGSPVWREVASAMSARGTLPGIQLTSAWEGYVGVASFRSKRGEETIPSARELMRAMESEQLTSTFRALRRATDYAIDAGYKHIQLHAAHGYFFSLLLDPRINPAADHAIAETQVWASECRRRGIETSLRISLRTGDEMFDSTGRITFLDSLASLPVDFIDVSSGFYNIDKRLIYPGRPDVITARRVETIALARKHPARDFIYSGRAHQTKTDELPPNVHIGLCRDLIANPDFLQNPSRGCMNAGRCHYFSRGEQYLSCSRWQSGSVATDR